MNWAWETNIIEMGYELGGKQTRYNDMVKLIQIMELILIRFNDIDISMASCKETDIPMDDEH